MNKYITALLIVLATTGVEAQTYQSALRAVLSENTIEDIYHFPEFKDLENDILCALKALSEKGEEEKIEPIHAYHYIFRNSLSTLAFFNQRHSSLISFTPQAIPSPFITCSIFIRGPNLV